MLENEENLDKIFVKEIQQRIMLFFKKSDEDILRNFVEAGLNDLNGPTLLVIVTKDSSVDATVVENIIARFPLELSCGMKLKVDNFPRTDGQLIFLPSERMKCEHVALLGLESSFDLSSCKLVAICRVNPLPLGFVCIKSPPEANYGSCKITGAKNVDDWMNTLGKIPWTLVSRKSSHEHIVEIEGDYVNAGQPFDNDLSNQETSIITEYKMCDSIMGIGETMFGKYLKYHHR